MSADPLPDLRARRTTSARTSSAWSRRSGACASRTTRRGDVLVIDDSSPDGTGALADELAAGRPWLHVLHRPRKEGLGRAYLDGFRWALARDYELRARDGLRLLARSARRAVAARGRARGRRPRARLALLPGRRRRELGPRAAPDLDRRLPVRAHAARRRRARPDRRLQVLPPRACSRRSSSTTSTRRATSSRSR